MTNSRDKGKRGEREVAKLFEVNGYTARRGQQFRGGPDSPDVIVEELPWLHLEVKNRERHDFWGAMEQAEQEMSHIQVPAVFSTKNGKPWLVTMRPPDFFSFLRRYVMGGAGGAKTNFTKTDFEDG